MDYTIIGRVSSGLQVFSRLQPGTRIQHAWVQSRY
jgi:hypothetical protein